MSVRKRPSRRPPARDVDATPFTTILDDLLRRVPGAYGAALVDGEGETVDYAGMAAPFDMRVAAAHLQIIVRQVEEWGALGAPRWLIVRGVRRSVVIRVLPEGYALAVLLRRRAGFTASHRAFAACELALAKEAGWATPVGRPWYPVEVEVDARGRPTKLRPELAVEVLGAAVGLPAPERGFRVRTRDGVELMLVREARHCWYADEDPAATTENPPLSTPAEP